MTAAPDVSASDSGSSISSVALAADYSLPTCRAEFATFCLVVNRDIHALSLGWGNGSHVTSLSSKWSGVGVPQ